MENIVQLDDIKNLFIDIIVDYEIGEFEFENHEDINNMIEKYILTKYNSLDKQQKGWLKDSLSYFITNEPEKLCRLNDDGYLPFEIPNNPIPFFTKIWEVLFNNIDFIYKGKPDRVMY